MIELKDYQKRAVGELKAEMIKLLNYDEERQRLVFKAPTGSGKTVMVSALLDELTQELPVCGQCKYTRVAWVWIAPNKLHQQSYRSMRNFFSETRSLRPVMFDECEVKEGLQPGEVLFLNWESINKDNAVLIRDNEQNRTLYELIRRTKIEQHVPVVVVIDEEHMFGGRNAKKSELVLQSIGPKIELRVSATPETSSFHAVEVRRSEVVAEEMIKKGVQLNPNINTDKEQSELTINQRLLKRALAKREELAEAYKPQNINPLLLIQLPNDNSDSLSSDERTIIDEMRAYLAGACDISEENGRLAVWLSKEKSPNLADINQPDNMTEVLLFKQAIALGWDCPRAAVLLIFRDLKSLTFTTQTVGRILRMPEQRFYGDERLNYGYVYTNLSEDIIRIVGDDMNYISSVFANRRKDFVNVELKSVYLDSHGPQRNRLGASFRGIFRKTMQDVWGLNPLTLFSPEVMLGEDEEGAIEDNAADMEKELAYNRQLAKKHGIQTDVARIFVKIPKDTPMTGTDGEVHVTEKATLALNASELNELFTLFCRKNVKGFAKYDSTPVLKGAIESALEEYFGMFESNVPKMVLYHRNINQFEDLIKQALNRYEQTLQQASTTEQAYQENVFVIPETRIYNSRVVRSMEGKLFRHALLPYFEQENVSKPEFDFSRWIDGQTEYVDWWYKNGDNGKQHFAVPYTASDGKKRCFYVDFIIRLKSGTVCLFDTKTPGSDEDTVEKHNALQDYVDAHNAKGVKMVGGVLMAEGENWYYPGGKIDTDKTTHGWTMLEFDRL